MIEEFGSSSEINPNETNAASGESAKFDTSQPMDFSNDSEASNFATEKDGNKETEGQIKENAIAEQVNDTSKPIDFSASEKSGLQNHSGEKLPENKGLSDEQKEQIKKETGWSDDIVDSIGSMEEYEIYKDAGLVEAEVNGKKCLINPNIDMNQTDQFGRTNKERMEQGLAPLNKDGKPIELHHIGQHPDSPLAELTQEQHRGKGNDSVLHDKTKESEIDRKAFDSERKDHWKTRAEEDDK